VRLQKGPIAELEKKVAALEALQLRAPPVPEPPNQPRRPVDAQAAPAAAQGAVQQWGFRNPDCLCNRAWEKSYEGNPTWKQNVDWGIANCMTEDAGVVVQRIQQQIDSAGYCGYEDQRRSDIGAMYTEKFEGIGIAGPQGTSRAWNWLWVSKTKGKSASFLFGCAHCKGFAVYDIKVNLHANWTPMVVEAESLKFAKWMTTVGVPIDVQNFWPGVIEV